MRLEVRKYLYGYADIDDRLVWNVVETSLPTLAQEIDDLLQTD